MRRPKKALLAICADLESQGDHSAANSLREGLEDTLHRLRVGKELRQQLRTTNRTEHVNSRIKHDVRRIKRWNNSNQTQRWTVMAVLDAERRRNRIVYQDQTGCPENKPSGNMYPLHRIQPKTEQKISGERPPKNCTMPDLPEKIVKKPQKKDQYNGTIGKINLDG